MSGEDRASRSGAAAPRCAVCGGPDADGNGCEFCPAVGVIEPGDLRELTNDALHDLINTEREQGRAHGEIAEAARILLGLREGKL